MLDVGMLNVKDPPEISAADLQRHLQGSRAAAEETEAMASVLFW